MELRVDKDTIFSRTISLVLRTTDSRACMPSEKNPQILIVNSHPELNRRCRSSTCDYRLQYATPADICHSGSRSGPDH